MDCSILGSLCINQLAHDELCSNEIRYLNHKKPETFAATARMLLHLIKKKKKVVSSLPPPSSPPTPNSMLTPL